MMLRTMTWVNAGSRDMKRVTSKPSNTILSWVKRVYHLEVDFKLFGCIVRLFKDESRSKTTIIILKFIITMTTTTFLTLIAVAAAATVLKKTSTISPTNFETTNFETIQGTIVKASLTPLFITTTTIITTTAIIIIMVMMMVKKLFKCWC
ncbi:hypothetical protein KQX54_009549 [Cotesia glomerata]|uniref:Uncharacterized protein n=1 Tax=Cotesia glomerata TaxID=32391 RepID=A0AAV7ICL1_COTGL|nr:hypothetical protein KQX54_009549 [Cotesia glomerata]